MVKLRESNLGNTMQSLKINYKTTSLISLLSLILLVSVVVLAGAIFFLARISDFVSAPNVAGDSYLGAVDNSNLVAHYKLDEKSGLVAEDTSENGFNGSLTNMGGDEWTRGKVGNALSLDGTNDYIETPDTDEFSFGNGTSDAAFSGAAWVYMNDATSFRILGKGVNSGDKEYAFFITSANQLLLTLYSNGSNSNRFNKFYVPDISSYEDQWVHLAFTYDGSATASGIELYINGVRQTNTSTNNYGSYVAMNNYSESFKAGAIFPDVSTSNGQIDDVRIYNKELTEEEVSQITGISTLGTTEPLSSLQSGDLYQINREIPDPILQTNFNQKSGTTANSDFGSNGTLENMTGDEWVNSTYLNSRQQVLDFDGTNDYVAHSFSSSSSDFTISGWFKKDSIGDRDDVILGGRDSGGGAAFWLGEWDNGTTGSGNYSWGFTNGSGWQVANSGFTISDTDWHFATGVKEGNNLYLYLDGELVKTAASTGTPVIRANLRIGNSGSNANHAYFGGMLDGIKIWNAALSHRDVAQEYNDGAPIGWWKLDKGEGGIAFDYSGNDNNGNILNSNLVTDWRDESECILNGCFNFDGANNEVDLPENEDFFVDNNDSISISTWVKFDSISGSRPGFVFSQQRCNGGAIQLGVETNKALRFRIQDLGSISAFADSPPNFAEVGEWYHLVGIRDVDADEVSLYVNGELIVTTIDGTTSTITQTPTSNIIGRRFPCALEDEIDGLVDEVKFFRYSLSKVDVLKEFNKGASLRYE